MLHVDKDSPEEPESALVAIALDLHRNEDLAQSELVPTGQNGVNSPNVVRYVMVEQQPE